MTAPKIEALRRAYERAAIESRQRGDQPWCLPNTVGFIYDAGLKAVAEMAIGAASAPMPEDAYKRLGNKSYWAAQADAERGRALRAETERDAARAEARQARREKNQALHELAATRRDAEKAHEALKAEVAELDRRLADAEDRRYELKEALCREEERRYAAMRRARVWKAAAKRRRDAALAEVERLTGICEGAERATAMMRSERDAALRARCKARYEALKPAPIADGTYEETDYIRAWARANQKSLPLTRDHYERAMAERPKGGGA